jgi:CheY-like chemotaxis protein
MDGYAATAEIRRREAECGAPRVRVVAMTGNSGGGERERCLAAGMDDYLAKPFRLEQLVGVLDRWLAPAGATAAAELLVDPAFMRRLLADGEEAGPAREIVELFRSDGASRLETARAALGREAGEELHDAAHALGGGSAMIGAKLVEQICAEIEGHCRPLNALLLAPLLDRLAEALAETANVFGAMIAAA